MGLIADPATITRVLTDTISQLGPSSTVETLKQPIQDITASSGKAGLALIIGLAGALWTASGYVGAFMRASNAIYEIEEGRPFYKLRPLQILVTLVLELMLDAPNCLVLDEPTNHLDDDSIEVLEDALEHYDGTVIAVSHDRYFLDRIADRIVHVADGEVRAYEGGWSANSMIAA